MSIRTDLRAARSKTINAGWVVAAGAVLVGLSACGSASSTAGDSKAQDPKDTKTVSCKDKDFLDQVIEVSAKNAGSDDLKLLSIYKPAVVSDRQAQFQAGKLKPAKGKNMVTVLSCNGVAATNDGEEHPLRYALQYDTNGDAFVSYEDRKN